MVLLTNKVAYHNLMIENFVDEWVSKKKPDIYLHCYNGVTKCHKELFGQTQFMRDILTSAKSIQCQCGVLRISLPCSIQMANILVRFLYMGEIKLARFNEAKVFEIFDNLHKILGFEPDMWRDCEEGFSTDDDDSSGDSSDPSHILPCESRLTMNLTQEPTKNSWRPNWPKKSLKMFKCLPMLPPPGVIRGRLKSLAKKGMPSEPREPRPKKWPKSVLVVSVTKVSNFLPS